VRHLYSADLIRSCNNLDNQVPALLSAPLPPINVIEQYRNQKLQEWTTAMEQFQDLLLTTEATIEHVLETAGLWPLLVPRILFGQLAFCSRRNLPQEWRAQLKHLCSVYIDYQALQRLLRLALDKQVDEFLKEYENEIAQGRASRQHVSDDQLLLEIAGDF
jgi:hypothetical protein